MSTKTNLSVNLNKIALIRNARGADLPNLIQVAKDCEEFGADGITVHPRPDQRHIRYKDIPELKEVVKTELNIEGNPTSEFQALVLKYKPDQVTLVPDAPGALTSDAGWNTLKEGEFLNSVIPKFQKAGIRVSLFIGTNKEMIRGAAELKVDRIELYTGPYAHDFAENKSAAIQDYVEAGEYAFDLGLGLNAGHDLNLYNLKFFKKNVPHLMEVSIGHALISDALYYGLSNIILMYKNLLR